MHRENCHTNTMHTCKYMHIHALCRQDETHRLKRKRRNIYIYKYIHKYVYTIICTQANTTHLYSPSLRNPSSSISVREKAPCVAARTPTQTAPQKI